MTSWFLRWHMSGDSTPGPSGWTKSPTALIEGKFGDFLFKNVQDDKMEYGAPKSYAKV